MSLNHCAVQVVAAPGGDAYRQGLQKAHPIHIQEELLP
jgi:hypothetical protein